MAQLKSVGLFCFLFGIFCVVSWKNSIIGVKGALLFVGRGLLFLGLFTLVTSNVYPRLSALFSSTRTVQIDRPPDDSGVKWRQEVARTEQQEKHHAKMSSYEENVLRPRKEAALKRKEEHFYHMTGETWKLTEGYELAETESELQPQEHRNETANQGAIRKRKLPENSSQRQASSETQTQKKPQKVIVLPEEPLEGTEGVVRVALRCPSGRTVHRRFLKSNTSSVLQDWLHKTGYHPTIYTLCTTYPRRPLITSTSLSLEDVGIVLDTVLNVEEKDSMI